MLSQIYWVKLERSLFRKPEWTVTLNSQKIGLYNDREAAVAYAVSEAERHSPMGRASEVWIDEGLGFTLYKSITVTKPEVPDDDDDGPADDPELDDAAYL